jgi:hypothetical protein
MSRLALALSLVTPLAACVAADTDVEEVTTTVAQEAQLSFTREHVTADIYHYELVLPVGSGPNAGLRIHRVVRETSPWIAKKSHDPTILLHGDFSSFVTNFAPTLGDPASPAGGMAPYLAANGVDVWGVDRRWTLPGLEDDISDLATMGLAQEVGDVQAAIAFARAFRVATGNGADRFSVVGFSHGGQLAYHVAAVDGGRPAPLRQIDAVAPLDWYATYSPEEEAERLATCELAAGEYQAVADGFIDSSNEFFIVVGDLARSAPDDTTPYTGFFGEITNREALLITLGQTYVFAPFAPFYHLLSPTLDGDVATGFAETAEDAATAWLAGSVPHQSMLEAADFDSMLCGDTPAIDAPLANIRVPLYYIGAEGGIGDLGLYTTTQVASTDVTTLVVKRYPDDRAADFGHGDLLFADDAPSLVFAPLAAWLVTH